MELLSVNVNSERLRGVSLLLYGSCIDVEAPDELRKFSEGRVPLHVCLQRAHMDSVGFKIATILMISKPNDITILTIDGSPHCLQLHFAVEQARSIAKSDIEVEHYVISKGKASRISFDAVKMAKSLLKIQECLIERSNRRGR